MVLPVPGSPAPPKACDTLACCAPCRPVPCLVPPCAPPHAALCPASCRTPPPWRSALALQLLLCAVHGHHRCVSMGARVCGCRRLRPAGVSSAATPLGGAPASAGLSRDGLLCCKSCSGGTDHPSVAAPVPSQLLHPPPAAAQAHACYGALAPASRRCCSTSPHSSWPHDLVIAHIIPNAV